MKKQYLIIALSLLMCLFIYMFYRTERTVVNELCIRLISLEDYTNLKSLIVGGLPLHPIFIYSLPEGLWIFCITLTSKPYYIAWKKWRLDCVYIPLMFCFSLEILQLVHLTNGRFDLMDICLFMLFWLLGRHVLNQPDEKRNLINELNTKMMICVASYGIVYLAHVLK